MKDIPGGGQQVEDALEQMYDIFRRRGVTMDESTSIKYGFETWFLYQLQQREGPFYEDAKELIEDNTVVRSIAIIRTHLEEIGKLPEETDDAH